jgi:hypothetical protein
MSLQVAVVRVVHLESVFFRHKKKKEKKKRNED